MEPGFDLIISADHVFDIERKLLETISFENFPEENEARILAYIMGVHDFAVMLADEIKSGNGYV